MKDFCIQINDLSYSYDGKQPILKKMHFNVPKGSIYGFLGPNGSGKSTTMKLLAGLLPCNPNSILLFGDNIQTVLPKSFSKIGVLIDTPTLYEHLSGFNNLRYISVLRNLPISQVEDVLMTVGLYEARHKKVKKYSLGMKQRLAIGIALLGNPDLLLLDEPVNGLDPNGMAEIRNLLVHLNQNLGITIFISSHLLAEIEKMCTHIAVINLGELKFEGRIEELLNKTEKLSYSIQLENINDFKDVLKDYEYNRKSENEIVVYIDKRDHLPEIITKLVNHGGKIYGVRSLDGLEESFLTLTEKTIN